MTDHTNFTAIVNASDTLASRLAELSERAITDARAQGVTIEPADVLDIREIRLATMGAPLDEEAYQRELRELPALSDVARKAAIADGDEDARAAAVAELDKITTDAAHARSTDARARKLARARDLGVTTAPVGEADDRNEKIRLLSEMSDHQARLRMARKWGLL
ncbi:hypothetical protein SAMN05444287_0906 [Octadecabacter temperatus]|uniref:Uncharacterized protein n=1 Tax=Octadecabacter temperatus TaxID=1458307 RepID=A0A0K0Y4P5_9RHOB|nr:hypothetical protein [Octadecabacter temperatus]AKS45807.1 hypothetical protein OSB_12520 [Octadecabacter temperatus]SIO00972.1 hypothetical protein SAMN05444287_0906 [Octadecabacter temperatus]